MYNASVAPQAIEVNAGDFHYQVSFERTTISSLVAGEAQFRDEDQLVVRRSRNGGESYETAVIVPLADALDFAKALVAQLLQAEEDAAIDRQYEYMRDRELDWLAKFEDDDFGQHMSRHPWQY